MILDLVEEAVQAGARRDLAKKTSRLFGACRSQSFWDLRFQLCVGAWC